MGSATWRTYYIVLVFVSPKNKSLLELWLNLWNLYNLKHNCHKLQALTNVYVSYWHAMHFLARFYMPCALIKRLS